MSVLKKELVSQREKLESYLEAVSGTGIVLIDPALNILDCNQGFTRMFQIQQKPVGVPVADFLIVGGNDLKNAGEFKLFCSNKSRVTGTLYCYATQAESGHLLFCERLLLTESSAVEQIGIINNELINLQRESVKKNLLLEKLRRELDERIVELEATIVARKRMEEEILALSNTDPLTNLHNRRGFIPLAEQQLKLSDRNKRGVRLYFADLDGLKWINDTLGHKEGDKSLIEAATVFRETFRASDIIARMGGDEFAILAIAPEGSNPELLPRRLQSQIDRHNQQENRKYRLSISIGYALYDPASPCSLDELMARADTQMYDQKRSKKDLLQQETSLSNRNSQ